MLSGLSPIVALLVFSILPAGITGIGSWSRRGPRSTGTVEQLERKEEHGHRKRHLQNDDRASAEEQHPAVGKQSRYYDAEIKRMVPSQLQSSSDMLSVGHFHTCALSSRSGVTRGGPIRCFGHNDKGQSTPPPGIFVQVSSGHHHSCAISSSDMTVSCWGAIPEPPQGSFAKISSGSSHSCGITGTGGKLICWGSNHHGESDPPPSDHGMFVQVSSGQSYSCGIRNDGSAECWGKDHEGQAQPPSGVNFKQISAGLDHHVCGITKEDTVKCWGRNSHGQSEDRDDHYIQVSTGKRLACAIREDDKSLECWGGSSPIPEHDMKSRQYKHISLGKDHACAVDVDRRLHCWQNGADLGAHEVPVGFHVGEEL